MRRQRGFTLIEIAIGMAILGIGVVSALEVFGSAVRVARISARRTEAIMHAKALMDSSLWAPEFQHAVSHGEIGDGFRWERTIRVAGPDDGVVGEIRTDVRLSVVTVLVEWDDPNGVKSYQLGTMRIEPNYEDPTAPQPPS
ncbi:MAG: type II secretion system protein [Deltaproteobacteria bacterium]|nr:type II secretion system protein [Deltaproteobacteria bacterium]